MPDNNNVPDTTNKQDNKKNSPSFFNITIAAVAVVFIGIMIVNNMATFLNIMKVVLGFGFVIMIHEFGHFIVAKVSGIKVEAFSIGFPPTILGIQKTEKGTRIRILPCLTPKKKESDDKNNESTETESQQTNAEEGMCYTIPSKTTKASDTEYRLGLIPAGGFVAMLGQSDSGPVEQSNDPKSFANKPVMIRIAVVAAGVIFNTISAVCIFMLVFSLGLELPPAVVGDVLRNSPAEKAGIMPGDRIKSVDGDTFVDFTSVPMAAALSGKGEKVNLVIEHPDGTTENIAVAAEEPKNMALKIRKLGIGQPTTNTIPAEKDFASQDLIDELYKTTGFKPGDIITAVNGTSVEYGWQMEELIRNTTKSNASLTVKRGEAETLDIDVPLSVMPNVYNFQTSFDMAHYYSLVPRLKIDTVVDRTKEKNWKESVINFWRKTVLRQKEALKEPSPLEAGDIIIKIADTDNPTYAQMREITEEHDNIPMPITVLRKDESGTLKPVEVTVTPLKEITRNGDGPVNIGITPLLDIEHPVVASAVPFYDSSESDTEENSILIPGLPIPSGAVITNIANRNIANFYDIVDEFDKNQGKEVTITYALNDQTQNITITVPTDEYTQGNTILAKSNIAVGVPFDNLREIYKASNPVEAIGMGLKKTSMFITQTLMTLKGLFTRSVSPTSLSGPLGIVTTSYTIAKESNMYYLYFLGLISSCIAVMNLLPLPVVDGGVIVLLLIEKIKGSPISVKVQEVISYAGLVLILSLFVWLFWNDVLNIILN